MAVDFSCLDVTDWPAEAVGRLIHDRIYTSGVTAAEVVRHRNRLLLRTWYTECDISSFTVEWERLLPAN